MDLNAMYLKFVRQLAILSYWFNYEDEHGELVPTKSCHVVVKELAASVHGAHIKPHYNGLVIPTVCAQTPVTYASCSCRPDVGMCLPSLGSEHQRTSCGHTLLPITNQRA